MVTAQQKEAARRLCALQAFVNDHIFHHEYAADCVCDDGPYANTDNYRNDFKAIEWIERVVHNEVVRYARQEARKR